jgi:ubiquinone/menaquinone biosynthesis C-methylase UbiE
MANYVIRGGEEGKARLQIISDALWPSTLNLLNNAGIKTGMSCLDVGRGGGNVTLAMARLVGLSGMATGVDMDGAKMQLAQQDAEQQSIAHANFRVLDADDLDYGEGFDLVYARLLLTHLNDPLDTLQRMVKAAKPGGVIVIEDMDHSAIFCHPACTALEQYIALYDQLALMKGTDPEIGLKLPALFRQAGLENPHLSHIQPAFMDGEAKHIHQITLENIAPAAFTAGLASEGEIDAMSAELDDFAQNSETIISFPRIFQVWAQSN